MYVAALNIDYHNAYSYREIKLCGVRYGKNIFCLWNDILTLNEMMQIKMMYTYICCYCCLAIDCNMYIVTDGCLNGDHVFVLKKRVIHQVPGYFNIRISGTQVLNFSTRQCSTLGHCY